MTSNYGEIETKHGKEGRIASAQHGARAEFGSRTRRGQPNPFSNSYRPQPTRKYTWERPSPRPLLGWAVGSDMVQPPEASSSRGRAHHCCSCTYRAAAVAEDAVLLLSCSLNLSSGRPARPVGGRLGPGPPELAPSGTNDTPMHAQLAAFA